MAKLTNKTQGFTIVTQTITKDRRLGIKERGMLLTLLALPDGWEFSVIGLSKILPDGKAAIQSAVQKLEECGYLKRVQAKGEHGKFAGYDWEIIAEPELSEPKSPLTENRSTGNRSTGNPMTEYPLTGNQMQLNTNPVNPNELIPNVIKNQSINLHEAKNSNAIPTLQNDGLIDGSLIARIKNQVCYDDFVQQNPFEREMADLIVNSVAQLSVANVPMVFSGATFAPQLVRERASAFTFDHIGYVIDSYKAQTGNIHNVPKYVLASVFNAPASFQTVEERGVVSF